MSVLFNCANFSEKFSDKTSKTVKSELTFSDSSFNSGSFLLIRCISSFFSDSCSARLEPIDPVAPKIKYLPDII